MSDAVARASEPDPDREPKRPPGIWRRASFNQRLVAIAGTVGTLIGVASIVIPLAAVAGTTTTTTDTVAVSVGEPVAAEAAPARLEPVAAGLGTQALGAGVYTSYRAGVPTYAVPVSAPWAELWALQNSPHGCATEEQVAWLGTHGTAIPDPYVMASLTNTAVSGSQLVVSNIRAQGELIPPDEDTVTVGYLACIGGGDEGVYAHLTIGVDPVAVFHECYAAGVCYAAPGDAPVSGEPVVFAVSPGQSRTLHLTYDQTVHFRGRFVATVSVDGKESTIDLSPGGVEVVSPVVTRPELNLYMAGDLAGTTCTADVDDPGVRVDGCTLQQWLDILGVG